MQEVSFLSLDPLSLFSFSFPFPLFLVYIHRFPSFSAYVSLFQTHLLPHPISPSEDAGASLRLLFRRIEEGKGGNRRLWKHRPPPPCIAFAFFTNSITYYATTRRISASCRWVGSPPKILAITPTRTQASLPFPPHPQGTALKAKGFTVNQTFCRDTTGCQACRRDGRASHVPSR